MNRILEFLETSTTGTLAIHPDEWDVMVADYRLARTMAGVPSTERRFNARLDCRGILAGIKFDDVSAPNQLLLAKCQNISTGGLCVANQFRVNMDTPCELSLLSRFGETVRTTGIVRYCVLQKNTKFNIGIQFDQTVNPKDFTN